MLPSARKFSQKLCFIIINFVCFYFLLILLFILYFNLILIFSLHYICLNLFYFVFRIFILFYFFFKFYYIMFSNFFPRFCLVFRFINAEWAYWVNQDTGYTQNLYFVVFRILNGIAVAVWTYRLTNGVTAIFWQLC